MKMPDEKDEKDAAVDYEGFARLLAPFLERRRAAETAPHRVSVARRRPGDALMAAVRFAAPLLDATLEADSEALVEIFPDEGNYVATVSWPVARRERAP